jgi:peroxiredoxin Q/BCP
MKRTFLSMVTASMVFGLQAAETPDQPQVGTHAPDFKLTAGDGSQVSLEDYQGRWVVLFFYPVDFTMETNVLHKEFQSNLHKYEDAGAVILGVSMDSVQTHKDFSAKRGLKFKLLSDRDLKVCSEYGSVRVYSAGRAAARNTFLINPKGEIAKVYTDGAPGNSHWILKDLSQLKDEYALDPATREQLKREKLLEMFSPNERQWVQPDGKTIVIPDPVPEPDDEDLRFAVARTLGNKPEAERKGPLYVIWHLPDFEIYIGVNVNGVHRRSVSRKGGTFTVEYDLQTQCKDSTNFTPLNVVSVVAHKLVEQFQEQLAPAGGRVDTFELREVGWFSPSLRGQTIYITNPLR